MLRQRERERKGSLNYHISVQLEGKQDGGGVKPPFRKRNHEGGVSSVLGHFHEWEKGEKESCSFSAISLQTGEKLLVLIYSKKRFWKSISQIINKKKSKWTCFISTSKTEIMKTFTFLSWQTIKDKMYDFISLQFIRSLVFALWSVVACGHSTLSSLTPWGVILKRLTC